MCSCSPLTGSDLVGGNVLRDTGSIGTGYAVALVVLPCTENDWYVVVFQLKLKLVVTSPTSSFSSGTTLVTPTFVFVIRCLQKQRERTLRFCDMSARGRRSWRQSSPSPVRVTRDVRTPTLKLPEFWDSAPAAWFAIVEAHFNKSNVTDDDDRYNHAVAMLGSSTAARVVGFLSAPRRQTNMSASRPCSRRHLSCPPRRGGAACLTCRTWGTRGPLHVWRGC